MDRELFNTMTTYVFDFYNLYIPKGKEYANKEKGIRIVPLKIAEDFEKNRTRLLSPYRKYDCKTAKCFIKSNNKEEARKIAHWLELIYSFAQSRSVFFLEGYEYKKGKKYSFFQSKFIVPRENSSFDLIYGTKLTESTYTRDISFFIDTAIKTLKESNENKQNDILTTINAYITSQSEIMWYELKFLIAWIALEKLANSHYKQSNNQLFKMDELKKIKEALEKALESVINKNDPRLERLKESIMRDFLYESDTYQKVDFYLKSLDLEFNERELRKLIRKLIESRKKLVHDFNSTKLSNNPSNLIKLQKILEKVIFRLLGIDKSLEKQNFHSGAELWKI